jgi:redox-regulated HSP33 family molecular chaperone
MENEFVDGLHKDVGMKDYFSGASPIVSGELGEDFTYYYATSEQTPSSVGLGVPLVPTARLTSSLPCSFNGK